MLDPKTIHIRLMMALSDAIVIEQTPVRKHEMIHMLNMLRERYKPKDTVIETKTTKS